MRHLRIVAAGTTLWALMVNAHAQALPADPNAEAPLEDLRAWDTYTVEPDGRYTDDADYILLIRNERGVHENAQLPFSYSDSRESIDVIEAFTETPDGRKIPVPADQILTKESPVSANAPMFADIKLKIIVFPAVEVHSKLHFRTRLTVKEPLFPGFFNLRDYVVPHTLDDDDKIIVYAAKGVTFRTDVAGFQGGSIACPPEAADRQCYAWSAHNSVFAPPEPGSVAATDYGQHVILSNFPSYEAIGKAYWDRAAKMVAVTPKIQALADQLTQGIGEPRAQAEALYNWVTRNIRYVAVYVGAGSVVPHPAETVLDNRYGDCKDHVTLLQSLLSSKHIGSVGVLVGADTRWKLPSVPDVVFNHIITYIPTLNLYVDSTVPFARFGELPELEVGKMGLKTQVIAGTKQFETISSPASEAHLITSVAIALDTDGNATGTAEAHMKGSVEIGLRSVFTRVPPGQEEMLANTLLAAVKESGSGTFTKGDPRDLTTAFAYETKFSIPNLVSLPGPGAFPIPIGLRFWSMEDLIKGTPLPRRQNPWTCGIPGDRAETTRLTLPPSMHIVATPKDVHVKNAFGSFDAHYELADSVITAARSFAHVTTRQPCGESDYQEFRELTQAIERDAKAQVLFQ